MSGLWSRVRAEPALATGLVSALVTLVSAFGLQLTAEQVGAIGTLTVALMALLTRSQVTPTVKLEKQPPLK